MSSHLTNAYHVKDHLAERTIYIKLAHQCGTFGVSSKILTISKIAKTLSNIQEHPKTIILFVSSKMHTKTEFPLQRSADIQCQENITGK